MKAAIHSLKRFLSFCRRRKGRAIPDSLDGFRAKVGRAKEHLDALDASVAAFTIDGGGYTVTPEANPELGVYSFRIGLKDPSTVTAWSLLIGDCIHNLRSALDHLYWALALTKHPGGVGLPQPKYANFPIYGADDGGFNGRKPVIEEQVGSLALAKIEKLQPFKFPQPKRMALDLINHYDAEDKHRLLVPTFTVITAAAIPVTVTGGGRFNHTIEFPLSLKDGAVAVTVKTGTASQGVMDVKLEELVMGVVFWDEGQPPSDVVPTLRLLLAEVEAIGNDLGTLTH